MQEQAKKLSEAYMRLVDAVLSEFGLMRKSQRFADEETYEDCQGCMYDGEQDWGMYCEDCVRVKADVYTPKVVE